MGSKSLCKECIEFKWRLKNSNYEWKYDGYCYILIINWTKKEDGKWRMRGMNFEIKRKFQLKWTVLKTINFRSTNNVFPSHFFFLFNFLKAIIWTTLFFMKKIKKIMNEYESNAVGFYRFSINQVLLWLWAGKYNPVF